MSSDSCTTYTPLVSGAMAQALQEIHSIYSHRTTGEQLPQPLCCPMPVSPAPRERRQPSSCCGRCTGDWLILLANRGWKMSSCQEGANKSWICQTNPFTTNTWRNPVRLLDFLSLEKICLSCAGGWSYSDHRAQSQPSPANQSFCKACEMQALWQRERLSFQKLLWNYRAKRFMLRTGNYI